MVLGPRLLYFSKACFAEGLSSVNEREKSCGLWSRRWFPSVLGWLWGVSSICTSEQRQHFCFIWISPSSAWLLRIKNLAKGETRISTAILKCDHVDSRECLDLDKALWIKMDPFFHAIFSHTMSFFILFFYHCSFFWNCNVSPFNPSCTPLLASKPTASFSLIVHTIFLNPSLIRHKLFIYLLQSLKGYHSDFW